MRSFTEIEQSFTSAEAIAEAGRCLRCGPCIECVRCHARCTRRQVALQLDGTKTEMVVRIPDIETVFAGSSAPRTLTVTRPNAKPVRLRAIPIVSWVDGELCRGCGRCVEACIHEAIQLTERRLGLFAAEVDPAACHGCGICITVCPSGAIRDRPPTEDNRDD